MTSCLTNKQQLYKKHMFWSPLKGRDHLFYASYNSILTHYAWSLPCPWKLLQSKCKYKLYHLHHSLRIPHSNCEAARVSDTLQLKLHLPINFTLCMVYLLHMPVKRKTMVPLADDLVWGRNTLSLVMAITMEKHTLYFRYLNSQFDV